MQGYSSTNAYLQDHSFYSGGNAAGYSAVIVADTYSAAPTTVIAAAGQPVSYGVETGDLLVTAYEALISYNNYWFTYADLQAMAGSAFTNSLSQGY